MIAGCPKCGAKYRVDPARLGPEGARLRCVKCDAVFRARAPEAPAAPVVPVPEPAAALAAPVVVAPSAPPPAPVEPPAAPVAQAPVAPPVPETTHEQAPSAAAAVAEAAVQAGPASQPRDRSRLVLVADSDVDSGKRSVAALESWGLEAMLVHDGVEAMLTIQRELPRAVVLDAALPKMFGFQICEVMKRNESLRHIGVVLVATIHRQGRYMRPPTDLYGADHYIEQPDLPDALRTALGAFGLPLPDANTPEPPAPVVEPSAVPPQPAAIPVPEPQPVPAAPEAPAPLELEIASEPVVTPAPDIEIAAPAVPRATALEPVEPVEPVAPVEPVEQVDRGFSDLEVDPSSFDIPDPAAESPAAPELQPEPEAVAPAAVPDEPSLDLEIAEDELGEQRTAAERLARIIVSDIVLYNEEEFAAGVQNGDVVQRLDGALEEGRDLFRQRVDERLRDESDFLANELLRVARSRGMA